MYAFVSLFVRCECDSRITIDHIFIVCHQKDLIRLNNNQQVKDLNLVDIQHMDLKFIKIITFVHNQLF